MKINIFGLILMLIFSNMQCSNDDQTNNRYAAKLSSFKKDLRLLDLYKIYTNLYCSYKKDKSLREKLSITDIAELYPEFFQPYLSPTHQIVIKHLIEWAHFAAYQSKENVNAIKTNKEYKDIQDLQSFQNEAQELTRYYTWRTNTISEKLQQQKAIQKEWLKGCTEILKEENTQMIDIFLGEILFRAFSKKKPNQQ